MKASTICFTRVSSRARLAKVLLAVTVTCTSVLFGSPAARAQSKAPAEKLAPSDAQAKKAAIQWMDEYLRNSVLIKAEDVTKIRETVANMSPSQLRQWLEQTRQLRASLESPEWQETRKWLRSFLKVQAIYSDQEIEQLRQKILKADPEELLDIMGKIEQKHRTLTWMHRSSTSERQASLKGRDAYLKGQASANKSARKSSSSSSRPLFGTAGGSVAKKPKGYKGYSVPGPLITSREVAREAVRRSVFPRGGWYGW